MLLHDPNEKSWDWIETSNAWTRFGYKLALKLRFANDNALDDLKWFVRKFELIWNELMIDFLKGILWSRLRK